MKVLLARSFVTCRPSQGSERDGLGRVLSEAIRSQQKSDPPIPGQRLESCDRTRALVFVEYEQWSKLGILHSDIITVLSFTRNCSRSTVDRILKGGNPKESYEDGKVLCVPERKKLVKREEIEKIARTFSPDSQKLVRKFAKNTGKMFAFSCGSIATGPIFTTGNRSLSISWSRRRTCGSTS